MCICIYIYIYIYILCREEPKDSFLPRRPRPDPTDRLTTADRSRGEKDTQPNNITESSTADPSEAPSGAARPTSAPRAGSLSAPREVHNDNDHNNTNHNGKTSSWPARTE